jgi:hypothetical protein
LDKLGDVTQQLDKAKRELDNRDEQIEIMGYAIKTITKVSLEILEFRQPTRIYTLFLKEKWHKN